MTARSAPRSPQAMTAFAEQVLTSVGVSSDHAATAARHLLWADIRGVETHGLVRLAPYVSRIRNGDLNADVSPELASREGATMVVDGHHGLGQVAADFAMRSALEAAQEHGVGVATVRRSGHFGAAGTYATMAAERGAIGIAATNAAPLMAPTGGRARRVGNNPFAVAAPHEPFPIVLDIAMSAVAAWTVRLAADRGEKIPEQWALDREGVPTTDPKAVYEQGGLLRPLGDHKGYGLSVMVDILTGVLADGGFGQQVRRLDEDGFVNASHFCLALRIDGFTDPTAFGARLGALAAALYDTPTVEGVDEILLPGQREAQVAQRRVLEGIPYPEDIFADLEQLAAGCGVPMPSPDGQPTGGA